VQARSGDGLRNARTVQQVRGVKFSGDSGGWAPAPRTKLKLRMPPTAEREPGGELSSLTALVTQPHSRAGRAAVRLKSFALTSPSVSLPLVILAPESSTRRAFGLQFSR